MAHTKANSTSHPIPSPPPQKWFASITCSCGKVFSKTTASRTTSERNVERRWKAHRSREEIRDAKRSL